jgi:isopentenyl diphosphate isomerase/L-lactate dehydrogenase-like FMN-dependent dehydrogenase
MRRRFPMYYLLRASDVPAPIAALASGPGDAVSFPTMANNFVTLPEIRRIARKRLSRDVWNFGAGGSETETSMRRNRRALDRLAIRQDVLVDVREIDLSTTFLGVPLSMPVMVAPMGGLVLFHHQGDVEMARGASMGDTLVALSGATGWPVEDVAKAGPGPKLFQLYHHGDRTWVSDLLARVEASGYISVCLTVDTQLYSRRERDIVNRYSPRQAMSVAPNPRGPDSTYPARLTWDDVEWLKKTTRLPIGLKGVMTARDAKRAVDTGVQVIWVSNHGGRQLDHTQATIDALPAIVDAVAGRAAIVIDGGFRRGTDVIKAVALGATVVAMGRAILWGLAADGADGVGAALEILRQELRTSLGLCGQTSVRNLQPDSILRLDY